MIAAPMSLLVAHTPVADERTLASLPAAELLQQLDGVTRLPLPSGQDVVAVLARALPDDLLLIETTLAEGYPGPRSNPLIGTTILIEAADLPQHSLEVLQQVTTGRGQQALVSTLVKVARASDVRAGRQALAQALQGKKRPAPDDPPNPILEAAAAAAAMRQTAETAAALGHSLILRYEEPPPPAVHPLTSFLHAQIRPLLLADLFAIAFVVVTYFRAGLWQRDGEQILNWVEPVLSYLLLLSGFLLPLWLAQARAFWQARGVPGVRFVPGSQADGLDPRRTRPFLLDVTPMRFVLCALYQPPPGAAASVAKPTRLYLALFGAGLLLLIGLLPAMPLNPWLAQFLTAYLVSTLAFGISHLLADR